MSAIFIGSFVSLVLVAAIESLSATLYPVSGDIAAADRATLLAMIHGIPLPAKLIIVAGWLIAPFAGVWLCLRIGDWPIGGWLVTAIFLVAAIVGQVNVPHPLWMVLCAVILPLLGGWLAQRVHRKPYPGEPLLG
ncbi:hypothetical protein [Sphingomonas glacialis]|uniref:hypothetical protein n=1 Tax=Sphingomonas glacialis TaxID=658225 RepID=UPI00112EC8A2|nr:hypothetical protein [Sphingomonas glacialis]